MDQVPAQLDKMIVKNLNKTILINLEILKAKTRLSLMILRVLRLLQRMKDKNLQLTPPKLGQEIKEPLKKSPRKLRKVLQKVPRPLLLVLSMVMLKTIYPLMARRRSAKASLKSISSRRLRS